MSLPDKEKLRSIFADKLNLKYNDIWYNSDYSRAIVLHTDKKTLEEYKLEPHVEKTGRKRKIELEDNFTEDRRVPQSFSRFTLSEDGRFLVLTNKESVAFARFKDAKHLFSSGPIIEQ